MLKDRDIIRRRVNKRAVELGLDTMDFLMVCADYYDLCCSSVEYDSFNDTVPACIRQDDIDRLNRFNTFISHVTGGSL